MRSGGPEALIAEIYNAGWWVRHAARPHMKAEREQAFIRMRAAVRAALDQAPPAPVLLAVARALAGEVDPT